MWGAADRRDTRGVWTLIIVAGVVVTLVAVAKADSLPVRMSWVRELPWLVFAIALAACVLAWAIIAHFPEPKAMPDAWYHAWEWVFGVAVLGGALSALTAWALPSRAQKISCFLMSLLVAFAAFVTMGAFI